MIIETILDLYLAFFSISSFVVVIFTCIKKLDFSVYIPTYLFFALGYALYFLRIYNDNFRIIGNIFFLLAVLSLLVVLHYDSHQVLPKTESSNSVVMKYSIIALAPSLLFLSLQIIIFVVLCILLILAIRLYKRTRNLKFVLICVMLFYGLLTSFSTVLSNINLKGAWEFSYVVNFFLIGNLMVFPIIVVIEERLEKSEKKNLENLNRVEFYKDIFVHDLNNILQSLNMSLDLISEYLPKVSQNLKELLVVAQKEIDRGKKLGINLNILSLIDKYKLRKTRRNISNIIEEAISNIKEKCLEKNSEFRIEQNQQNLYISVNNSLFREAIKNLLYNAIKFNKNETKQILINVVEEKRSKFDYVRVEIIDNGIGVPDTRKEVIFQKIKEKNEGRRTGLGLIVVKEIIESYDGYVWVEDRIPGDYSKGSKFILLIPLEKRLELSSSTFK